VIVPLAVRVSLVAVMLAQLISASVVLVAALVALAIALATQLIDLAVGVQAERQTRSMQTDESFVSHIMPSPVRSLFLPFSYVEANKERADGRIDDSTISHLCGGDPSLPTSADERLLVMATKRKTKALSGKRMKKASEDAAAKHLSPMGTAEAMFENIPQIPCEDTTALGLTPSAPPTAQPTTDMHKHKVVTRKRHKQTPKALPSPTDHVALGAEEVELHKRFGKDTAFTRQLIHGYLIDVVGSYEKEDIENTVRLWIFLLLSTFLAPWSAYVCSPQMIKYLDDIERIRSYAWDVAFHELILHNIEEASKMVKMNARRGRHDESHEKIISSLVAPMHQVESKLSIHASEQWLLEGQRGNANSEDFAPAEETSTPALTINVQMAALVDALKAAEESRKVENEDFRQKLESIMTQVEGFAKSINSLRHEKEKPADVPPSDPPCDAVEKENFEEEVKVLQKVFCSCGMQDAIEDWELKFDMDCPS
ncbi:hypothetical protein Taro_033535, partial [Colocasia esculenta]|nr:hypothetical protein [Colocasia esculenta]